MQYKIPVQIENEDPIIWPFSLRQLIILMIWWALAYMTQKWLAPSVWLEISLVPSVLIFLIFLMVVLFKHSEMTFVPFILNLIRLSINGDPKIWVKWTDSFEPMEIWYLTQNVLEDKKSVNLEDKKEKLDELKEKLSKI